MRAGPTGHLGWITLAWLGGILGLGLVVALLAGDSPMASGDVIAAKTHPGEPLLFPDCRALEARAIERGWPTVEQAAPTGGWERAPLGVAVWGLPTLAATIRHGDTLTCGSMTDARRRDPRFTAGVGAVLYPSVDNRDPVVVRVMPDYSRLWPATVYVGDAVQALRADRLRWMTRTGVVAALLVLLSSTVLAFASTRPASLMMFLGALAAFLVWALEISGLAGYPQRWLSPIELHFFLTVALPLPVMAAFCRSLLIQADVERHHHRIERLSMGLVLATLATVPVLWFLPPVRVIAALPALEILLVLISLGLFTGAVTVWRKRRDALKMALAILPFLAVCSLSLLQVPWVQVWKVELVLGAGTWLAIVSHLVAARRQSRVNRDLEMMKHLASTDDLTGLPNRRAVLATLELEFARAVSRGPLGSLPLALIDLDRFKRINDTLGHAVGDQCLQHFARRVRAVIRRGDMIGRTGGEEFVLLLPDATLDEAVRILDTLHTRLAEPFAVDGHSVRLAFSAGLVDTVGFDAPQDALNAADRLLYRAKEDGRGRTVSELDVPQVRRGVA